MGSKVSSLVRCENPCFPQCIEIRPLIILDLFLKKNGRAIVDPKLELKFNLKNGDGEFYNYKPSKMNMAHRKKDGRLEFV